MRPLLVLTRVDAADDALVLEAGSMGFDAMRLHLLGIEPGADAGRLRERLGSVEPGTAIAWTSRRAALALTGAVPRDGRALKDVPLYAVGADSAEPLRRTGLVAQTPKAEESAAALARLIAERARGEGVQTVLFLHGNRALPDLPDGLRAAGLTVEPLETYRTVFLFADTDEIDRALDGARPLVTIFYSPSGIEALERLLVENTVQRLRERSFAIARGGATLRALNRLGYRNSHAPAAGVPFEQYAREALSEAAGGRT